MGPPVRGAVPEGLGGCFCSGGCLCSWVASAVGVKQPLRLAQLGTSPYRGGEGRGAAHSDPAATCSGPPARGAVPEGLGGCLCSGGEATSPPRPLGTSPYRGGEGQGAAHSDPAATCSGPPVRGAVPKGLGGCLCIGVAFAVAGCFCSRGCLRSAVAFASHRSRDDPIPQKTGGDVKGKCLRLRACGNGRIGIPERRRTGSPQGLCRARQDTKRR